MKLFSILDILLGSESVYVVLIADFLFSEFIVVFLYAFIQENVRHFMTEFAKVFVIQSAYIIRMKKLLVWTTKV